MTGRPADHPRPPHRCTIHEPSRACYNAHGCRCLTCCTLTTRYRARYGHGLSRRVPAAPILAHLERLYAAGMNRADVATAAGIDESTIRPIDTGKVHAVNRPTAAAILACKPTPGIRVPSAGTARRLQALAAIGWTAIQLADATGIDPIRLRDMRVGRNRRIDTSEARAVADAYEECWDKPQTGTKWNRALCVRARRYGWLPPLAWDDGRGPHGIDNPAATPAVAPDPTGATHRADELAMLLDAGESAERAVLQCGWPSHESALVWLARNGRHDLAERIRRDPALMRKVA